MDRMDDSKATPTKRTGANDEVNFENDMHNNDNREIEQPNRSNATPSIPQEIPIREGK